MTHEELETELADLFEDAISASWDMDWEPVDGAAACAKAIMAAPDLAISLIITLFGSPDDHTIN